MITAGDYLKKAHELASDGQHTHALKQALQALSLAPDSIPAQELYAQLLGTTEQFPETIVACSRLLTLDPENLKAFLFRGFAYYMQEQDEAAIADFEKALTLSPDHKMAKRLLDELKG